jgi:hypothetical protein
MHEKSLIEEHAHIPVCSKTNIEKTLKTKGVEWVISKFPACLPVINYDMQNSLLLQSHFQSLTIARDDFADLKILRMVATIPSNYGIQSSNCNFTSVACNQTL